MGGGVGYLSVTPLAPAGCDAGCLPSLKQQTDLQRGLAEADDIRAWTGPPPQKRWGPPPPLPQASPPPLAGRGSARERRRTCRRRRQPSCPRSPLGRPQGQQQHNPNELWSLHTSVALISLAPAALVGKCPEITYGPVFPTHTSEGSVKPLPTLMIIGGASATLKGGEH